MPNLWGQSSIIILWIVMTSWLFQREVLEQAATDQGRSAVQCLDLTPHGPRRWTLFADGREVGGLTVALDGHANGSLVRTTVAGIGLSRFYAELPSTAFLTLKNTIELGPKGKMNAMKSRIGIRGTEKRMTVDLELAKNSMTITGEGVPFLGSGMTLPIETESVTEGLVWPIETISNLEPDSRWETHVAGTTTSLTALSMQSFSEQVVVHEVTGATEYSWAGENYECYVVEHRYRDVTARSMVRRTDGRVLQQQVVLAGHVITLVPQPM